MNVTIPATVTNLAGAFYGCTTLSQVTLEHAQSALTDGTVTMTNAFQGCTNLAKVICHNAPAISESDEWHAWRIRPAYPSSLKASVQCFNQDGSARFTVNDTPTDVVVDYGNGTDLTLPVKSNMIAFGAGLDGTVTDGTDTMEIAAAVMLKQKSVTSNENALSPMKKNFVLWADDPTAVSTNVGGGGETFKFPKGYIYIQLNGKSSPANMGMQPAAGCAWVDISADYASYPYIKIGSGTTQNGRVLNHTHGMAHFHSHRHRHPSTSVTVSGSATGAVTSSTNNAIAGSGAMKWCSSGNFTWYPTWSVSASGSFTVPNNSTNNADNGAAGSDYSSRYTGGSRTGSYGSDTARNSTDGNASSNTTNEVNATYAIVWEVQQI